MAQINVIGFVTDNIIPKQSQKGSAGVLFYLKEYTGKSRYQVYQIWARGEIISRILRLKLRKGSHIWLTGSIELVDHTASRDKKQIKMLRIYCSDFGIVSSRNTVPNTAESMTADSAQESLPVELDGDRDQLPE